MWMGDGVRFLARSNRSENSLASLCGQHDTGTELVGSAGMYGCCVVRWGFVVVFLSLAAPNVNFKARLLLCLDLARVVPKEARKHVTK